MYLSKLVLNPRSRWVQQDCADRYRLHQTVYSGFAKTLADDERILFRLEISRQGTITVLVQSHDAPEWTRSEQLQRAGYLVQAIEAAPYQPKFKHEQRLFFRLEANPTVKRDGKRLALRSDEAQAEWIARKGAENGFQIDACQIMVVGDVTGRQTGHSMTWFSARFDGVLTVTDAEKFAHAVAQGIGSAKSFGFGLLSVLPYTDMSF